MKGGISSRNWLKPNAQPSSCHLRPPQAMCRSYGRGSSLRVQATGEIGLKCNFLSNYSVGNLIGSGRYGRVFAGYKRAEMGTSSIESFAIKVVPKRISGTLSIMQQIRDEVEHLKRLGGRQIVSLIDAFEDDQNVYIVQEMISGQSLERFARESGPLDEVHAAQVFAQICSALGRLHMQGMVYGDVKPANFMLKSNWDPNQQGSRPEVVMVDLGTVKQLRPWEEHLCQQQGTIPYFAPEVFSSRQGLKSDTWSAGCLLYELLTGTLPFWQSMDDIAELCGQMTIFEKSIRTTQVRWDHPNLQHVSPDCLALLRLLLEKDEAKRIHISEALDHPFIRTHVPDAPRAAEMPVWKPRHCTQQERDSYLKSKRKAAVSLIGRSRGGRRSRGASLARVPA